MQTHIHPRQAGPDTNPARQNACSDAINLPVHNCFSAQLQDDWSKRDVHHETADDANDIERLFAVDKVPSSAMRCPK
jgi:hypothetical protein